LFHLKNFSAREGHCQMPRSFKTNDGYKLGLWIAVQRRDKHKMDPDRRQRLEALPGWVWKVEK
ncbi:MAG: helicase associated domain-containing protein, partial [Pseudolabrys sp.]